MQFSRTHTANLVANLFIQKYGNECLILTKTTFGIVLHCRAVEGRKILKITLLKWNSVKCRESAKDAYILTKSISWIFIDC